MIGPVIAVLGLFAVFAWGLAVVSAIRIVRLAPAGQRFKTYGQLGWWQFGRVRAAIGPAADQHIRTYQRAFIAFIVCVFVAFAVGGVLSVIAHN
ncbi:MAG: hypothetical protein ABIQ30_09070 [Devosia sp.]